MNNEMIDKAIESVTEKIDDVTDPQYMTKKEYAEFLDILIVDLRIRKEAVDQELKEQEEEDDG